MAVDALTIVRAVYVAAYAAIFVIDLRSRRIPNVFTYPLLAIVPVARPGSLGLVPLDQVLTASAVAALFFFFSFRGWMGMGDVKLAVLIALAEPPPVAIAALWLAFAGGAVSGVILIAARRAGPRTALPFGPFLALAGTAAALTPELVGAYSPFAVLWR
ncbi:MAG: prepilin peptidase [Chloroflexi bacterium]|nr:prepilin peptidase [Chloroflexota bacterium]